MMRRCDASHLSYRVQIETRSFPRPQAGFARTTVDYVTFDVALDIPTDDRPHFWMPRRAVRPGHRTFVGGPLPACAGFMLIETRAITELGLAFGNTRLVVAILIVAILLMASLAKLLVDPACLAPPSRRAGCRHPRRRAALRHAVCRRLRRRPPACDGAPHPVDRVLRRHRFHRAGQSRSMSNKRSAGFRVRRTLRVQPHVLRPLSPLRAGRRPLRRRSGESRRPRSTAGAKASRGCA